MLLPPLPAPLRSDEELVRGMTQHPLIVERPILVAGDRAVVAKPPERVLELVPGAAPGA